MEYTLSTTFHTKKVPACGLVAVALCSIGEYLPYTVNAAGSLVALPPTKSI